MGQVAEQTPDDPRRRGAWVRPGRLTSRSAAGALLALSLLIAVSLAGPPARADEPASPVAPQAVRAAATPVTIRGPVYCSDAAASNRFAIRWTAALSPGATGTPVYDIQRRTGSNGFWTAWLTRTTVAAASFKGSPGKTYYFRALARGSAEDTPTGAEWASARAAGTVVPFDERSARYSGRWRNARSRALYLGRSRWTTRRGASARIGFVNARQVGVIITRGPYGGYANAYIGSKRVGRISFYSPRVKRRVRVMLKRYSVPTAGTLRIVATGTRPRRSRGTRVDLDGFAVFVATRPVFGVNSSLGSLDSATRQRALSMIRAAGSKWVQTGAHWPWIDRNGPERRDWSVADAFVDDALRYGQEPIMEILGFPGWANGRPGQPYYVPADTSEYSRFCADVVNRYKGRVRYYQVWNEPNGPFWTDADGRADVDAAAFARLARGAYLAIKQADPEAKVILGAIDRNHMTYLRTLYATWKRYPDAASNRYYFDILGAHPYADDTPPESANGRMYWTGMDRTFYGLWKMKRLMDSEGDRGKHVIITEMAWPIHKMPYSKGVGLTRQAQYLARAYRMVQRWPWVDAMLWYGFKNYDWWDEEPFSLVNRDLSPRPAYRVFRTEATR